MSLNINILLFLLAAMSPLPALNSTYDLVVPATLDIQNSSNVQISGFSAASLSMQTGASTDFSVTIYNVGNSIDDYSASIRIYDSAGALKDLLIFSNAIIVGGESQTLTKSWSSAGLPAGAYTAIANLTYGVFEKNQSLSITLTAPPADSSAAAGPSPSSTGGTRGRFDDIYKIPDESLTLPKLAGAGLQVMRQVIFKDLVAGESSFEFISLQNPGSMALIAGLSSSGPSAFLSAGASTNLLAPNQESTIAIPFSAPADAEPGYYLLQLDVKSGGQTFTLPVVVHILPSTEDTGRPQITHSVEVSHGANPQTTLVLSVENLGNKPVDYFQIRDQLPASLMQGSGAMQFSVPPSSVDLATGNVRWDFSNLQAGEKRSVAYRLSAAAPAMEAYSQWKTSQTLVSNAGASSQFGSQKILVRELRLPSLMPGEEGWVNLKLFNVGASSQGVEVSLLAPQDWAVAPRMRLIEMPARESAELAFLVRAPEFESPGMHVFSLRLDYGGASDEQTFSVLVFTPLLEPAARPLGEQLAEWAERNKALLAAAALILLVLPLAIHFTRRKLNQPRHDSGRAAEIKNLERMFQQK